MTAGLDSFRAPTFLNLVMHLKSSPHIAFTKRGAQLPIAHALRLLSNQELRFGLTKLKEKNRFHPPKRHSWVDSRRSACAMGK